MVTVVDRGGLGYAATSDTSAAGLAAAFARARDLAPRGRRPQRLRLRAPCARRTARPLCEPGRAARRHDVAQGQARPARAGRATATHVDARIVDWSATLWTVDTEQLFVTGDGGSREQRFSQVIPNVQATATIDGVTQTRSAHGQYNGFCQQGGWKCWSARASPPTARASRTRRSRWPRRRTARAARWTWC
jgi:predicted Zn-dependent protease